MASSIKKNKLIQWLQTQISVPAFIHTAIIFSIFGYVPGAWLFGAPLLLVYGLIKQKSFTGAMRQYQKGLSQFSKNFAKNFGERLADTLTNHPLSILKAAAAFFLLCNGVTLLNILGVYGLYRYTNNEWKTKLTNLIKACYHFAAGFQNHPNFEVSFYKKLILFSIFTLILTADLYFSGLQTLMVACLGLLQLGTFFIGATAAMNDCLYILANPMKVVTQNSGKILGMWWGRRLAHFLFSGRLQGTLGVAQGSVVSGESFFWLFPKNKFIFGTGYLSLVADRTRAAFNNFLTSVLFTLQVETTGSFSGVVGPGPVSVLLFIMAGYCLGYAVEKLVENIFSSISEDSKHAKDSALSKARDIHLAYYLKVHFAFIAGFTPFVMLSAGGPALIAFANGSVLGGTAIAVGGMASGFVGLYVAGYAVMRAGQRLLGRRSQPIAEVLNIQRNNTVETPSTFIAAPITPAFVARRRESNLSQSVAETETDPRLSLTRARV